MLGSPHGWVNDEEGHTCETAYSSSARRDVHGVLCGRLFTTAGAAAIAKFSFHGIDSSRSRK